MLKNWLTFKTFHTFATCFDVPVHRSWWKCGLCGTKTHSEKKYVGTCIWIVFDSHKNKHTHTRACTDPLPPPPPPHTHTATTKTQQHIGSCVGDTQLAVRLSVAKTNKLAISWKPMKFCMRSHVTYSCWFYSFWPTFKVTREGQNCKWGGGGGGEFQLEAFFCLKCGVGTMMQEHLWIMSLILWMFHTL